MKCKYGFAKYVEKEKRVQHKFQCKQKRKHPIKIIAAVLGLLAGGCGHTFRETGLAAIRITGAALADTGRICTNGSAAMGNVQDVPKGQPDSMQLDHEAPVSWQDVLASIEKGQ